tara:strand:+ start:102 stop:467 length:366 start_codon:yes stop_codon:yes gene_type:complete
MSGSDTIVGQVKWFSNQLNYGFVTVLSDGEHNGIDVFVHQTNITPQVSNYRTLTQGEYVSFNLTHNEGDKHPYHGTNLTGYGGGKLLCDFQKFVPKQQREEFNNNDGSAQKKEYRSRDNSN